MARVMHATPEGDSLEVSEAKEQTAVKHNHGSFSSLRTLLDATHFRHDAYHQDEEDVSSTWPSLSLLKFHTHNVDNGEPLPYPGEPVGDVTEGQIKPLIFLQNPITTPPGSLL